MKEYSAQIDSIISICEDNDALFICDKEGTVVYCRCPISYSFTPEDITGKHILEVFPSLTESTSSIMQVLKTGEASLNHLLETETHHGRRLVILSSALPVLISGEVVGLVDSFKFYHASRIWSEEPAPAIPPTLDDVVGTIPAMLTLKTQVREIAHSNHHALVYGEAGSGKALIAHCIHTESTQANGPFLSLSCTTFPPRILECVLFGTEHGCYIGAEQHKGLLEAADGGTLYLSHFDTLDFSLQKKLLSALEEGKLCRLGGKEEIAFHTRVICAVNSTPKLCLLENRLLLPLYLLIGENKLSVPALRDRPEDILPLARHFIGRFNREFNQDIKSISSLAEGLLQTYAWPGNVLELRNTIENAFHTMTGDSILVDNLKDILMPGGDLGYFQATATLPGGFSLTAALEVYECNLIRQALAQTVTVAEAARLLGLSRQLLQYKMQKFEF